MVKFTKVIINSVVVKDSSSGSDPKKVISWEYEKDSESISDAEISLIKDVNNLVDLSNGQSVEIWGGNTTSTDKRLFSGKIDQIKPDGARYDLICSNDMIDLVRKDVNKVYDSSVDASAGEISEIVKDLIETYGGLTASVQSSGTADGEKIDEFKCINTDIYERIQVLKKALNWDLFYDDSTKIVHFQPRGFVDSGKTLNVKQEIIGLPEWDIDTTNMINDLRVDGATIDTTITESGQIGVTADWTTSGILLTKTPNSAELYMDASNPPTTQKEGGSKDASSSNFYYIDRENKKIKPATGTTFTANHYAKVNYIWSSPAPIHMVNQDSIDLYGTFQKTLELNDITSVADAESRATNILNRRSVPFVTAEIRVRLTDVPNRGELVQVEDDISPSINGVSLSGSYVVNSIKYQFPSPFETIKVGDSQWRLADWQQNTEERVKRLEEQFVRNQDIITELRSFQNNSSTNFNKIQPRYRKIRQANIAGEAGIYGSSEFGLYGTAKYGTYAKVTFILGHSSAGVLGTSKLGSQVSSEVDWFVQQYSDSYDEEFIDDDFKHSNTTATWGSGSVTFTSGQIAESSSIDLRNGTITSAKLTSTETSGSFTYQMTADGTNWENVTSGTAHTFTNTGTDLRWRATENASSTGEISELKIENYH